MLHCLIGDETRHPCSNEALPLEWGAPVGAIKDVFHPIVSKLDPAVLSGLAATGASVSTEEGARADASRDFWPLAQRWALAGRAPARPAAVVRPESAAEVAAVLQLCDSGRVPVTVAGGRSGVCGGAIPLFGGIALDSRALVGVYEIDEASGLVESGAGTFGPVLEEALAAAGLSVGHYPQSMDLATVGGWVACRGAGQYSTRYGKIEDIVAGLEVCLADGRIVRTGAAAGAGPRAAMGPDLTALFVGSEGILGVISSVVLRAHPLPDTERRRAYSFPSFESGLEAARLTLRRGATPAVLRLYDRAESSRQYGREDCVLLALDEGDEHVVTAAMQVLSESCAASGGAPEGEELVDDWVAHRNDVSRLADLLRAGIVVETVEVAARWAVLASLYSEVTHSLRSIDGCLSASAHESHAYRDGACLYFSFAGRGPDPSDDAWAERYYSASLGAVLRATRRAGGSISHHHGIGLVRGPYLADALGSGFSVLTDLKAALDPNGILNPGKLGLASPFGNPPVLGGVR